MIPIFIAMKKVIIPLNSFNSKEGLIGEMMVKQGLCMWMMMHSHHVKRIQKEKF